jgi:hypothetical protein
VFVAILKCPLTLGDSLSVGAMVVAVRSSQYAKCVQLGRRIKSETETWARIHIRQFRGDETWKFVWGDFGEEFGGEFGAVAG